MILFFLILFQINSFAGSYPEHWWKEVAESERRSSWEILPHEVDHGEVVLSKRNELGIFSNFGYAPIVFEGIRYASVEGLWQMMKYPDTKVKNDPRNLIKSYPYTRIEVKNLYGFEAKKAGDIANELNRNIGINWVSYRGKRFNYRDNAKGSELHYKIIYNAIKAKVEQNPRVKKLLMKTKGLILKPDHYQDTNVPESYKYYDILMKIRDLN